MSASPRGTTPTSVAGDGSKKGEKKAKKEHVRKKAWKPKTKTGCMTCRVRRVKCDEAKPYCLRCTSTGRTCDGYPTLATTASSPHEDTPSPPESLIAAFPGLTLRSQGEKNAFQFFKSHTVKDLSGFFDSNFWGFEVLQASHTIPAIRHAVISLAAMHRKFVEGRMPVLPNTTSDEHIRFALQQSTLALEKRGTSDIDLLTISILFYCISCFEGHQSTAINHLRGGLRILRQAEEERKVNPKRYEDQPISLETLRSMFIALDVEVRAILSTDKLANWEPLPWTVRIPPPETFRTFLQTKSYLERFYCDIRTFVQDSDLLRPIGPEQEPYNARMQAYREEYSVMNPRLDAFLVECGTDVSEDERDSILWIRLWRQQIKLTLNSFLQFDETSGVRMLDWHVDEHGMGVIVDIVGQLLKAPSDLTIPFEADPRDYFPSYAEVEHMTLLKEGPYSRPVFTSGNNVGIALWHVVSKARSANLRRRAIALMLGFPRGEGVWNSVIAGRIAWERLILEETAHQGVLGARRGSLDQPPDSIPDENRVRGVDIEFMAPRLLRVEFKTIKQFDLNEPGFVKMISW
ncbi:hypothetical protein DM02DRAFT_613565 [Periconia macrospinosa]|uniref:Zn(2)-C6 fungal-type domain-containing protein n=1 Tax=Periconia macrospinosa TaxID=97972 RepID=A0A2V1DTI7_9PLEO|nr:hypothetical protein DM02DRAFT_613565 [Periconia macrospinosa]